MHPCPECGQNVEEDRRLCPHCGAAMPPTSSPLPPEHLPVWPPPPTGSEPPPPADPGPLLTKSVRGDVALGFAVGVALCVGLPLLSAPLSSVWGYYWVLWFGVLGPMILAFGYRSKLPSFARGAKYCAWTQGTVLLGALALCFSQLAGMRF